MSPKLIIYCTDSKCTKLGCYLILIFAWCCQLQLQLTNCQYALAPKACENGNVTLQNFTEQDIADTFFKPYGNWQRPKRNATDIMVVNITFVIMSIQDVVEKELQIVISGYIGVRWFDELRAWSDVFPYNCLEYVVIPATEIWIPEIALLNSDEKYKLMGMPGERVRLHSNGYAAYSPGGSFQASCEFDFTMFPFDSQTCSFKFESWRYTRQYLSLRFGGNVTIRDWTENEQWSLVNTKTAQKINSYGDPHIQYDHLEFSITIKRKIMYYMMNVIIPSMLIAMAHLATFSIPTGDVEKLEISFTCLLAYSVFQLMVNDDMPRSSVHVPLLSIYIDLQMGYIAMSMLGEGLCFLALNNIDDHTPNGQPGEWVPHWLMCICGALGYILCMRPPIDSKKAHRSRQTNYKMHAATISNGRIAKANNNDPNSNLQHRPDHNGSQRNEIGNNEAGMADIMNELDAVLNEEIPNHADGYHRHRMNEKTFDLRQTQWRYVAHIIDRTVLLLYVLSLTLTPIGIFGIHPIIGG